MENEDLYKILNSFKSRTEAYQYFGFCGNNQGITRLQNIARSVGFDLKIYDIRRKSPKKYCKQCNKEFIDYEKIFCSRSCAAKYNNSLRKHSEKTKIKISKSLTKINKFYEKRKCPNCDKIFETLNINKKICCSQKCGSNYGGRLNRNNSTGGHKITLICHECKQPFIINWNKRNQKFCSNNCRFKNKDYLLSISNINRLRCSSLEEKKRLRDIGRKGGFGLKGKTENGTKYSSKLEKQCFEWLEENKIKFHPHKYLPNSSKVSDIYLNDYDLWVELDGINREKKKKWLGRDYEYWTNKLEIYKQNNLNYKIFYTLSDLKEYIEEKNNNGAAEAAANIIFKKN